MGKKNCSTGYMYLSVCMSKQKKGFSRFSVSFFLHLSVEICCTLGGVRLVAVRWFSNEGALEEGELQSVVGNSCEGYCPFLMLKGVVAEHCCAS